jgi:peptide chain release factor 2
LEAKTKERSELEQRMAAPGFWENQQMAQKVIRRVKYLKGLADPVLALVSEVEDLDVLLEMAVEENDADAKAEAGQLAEDLADRLDKLEFKSMLNRPEDPCSVFLSIHAGAGGTESCDWAEMLLRMYVRWAERDGYKATILERGDGEEAGIRNATIHIVGEWAFGYLKSEVGVHRLVRISPFDSASRRHTTFAAVDVVPDMEDDIDIELDDADLEMEFTRSSGPGGQHVNKTSSAVRLKHLPTGITVLCQNERSQHKNRQMARKLLQAKLHEHERRKREKELEKVFDEKGEIAWGNQIRSYVLHPYQMVKDLRSEHKTGNTAAVLDGDLMPFMEAYLRFKLGQGSGDGAGD